MIRGLKILIVLSMVVTWLVTSVLFYQSPGMRGKIAIVGVGILVNCLLAFAYSYLGLRPASFRDWFKM